jgi:hypothetical protein
LRPSETGCAAGRRESLPCAKGGTLKTKNVNTSAAEIHTEAAAGHFFAAQGFFLRGPLLGEKLEVLSKKLGTAFKDGAASERDRYFQALSALGEFLQGFNGTNDYAFRLADLAFALRDLDKGIIHPLFESEARPGSPFDSEEVWRARMVVALGIESLLLMQTGETKEEVIASVNMKYRDLNGLVRRRGSKFTTSAAEWHLKFVNGEAPTPETAKVWANCKRYLDEYRGNLSDPAAIRDFLLKTAHEAFREAEKTAVKRKSQK